MEERPTADLAAFDLYIQAKKLLLTTSFSTRGKDNLLQAVQLLDQALARDPRFLDACCQLASAHDQLYFLGLDHTSARRSLGDAAVERALRLKPDAGEAHLARARHLYQAYLAYEPALAELTVARRLLPNDPSVFALTGYIARRQGRWEESTRDLENALAIDPRNFYTLQQISLSYNLLRRYPEMAEVLDRALAIVPNDIDTRVIRAEVEFSWRADTRPLHAMIDAILAQNPAVAPDLAEEWLFLALSEHDPAAADRALAALKNESFGVDAIQLSRAFGQGLAARARGDGTGALAAFAVARAEQEKVVSAQADFAPALCVLGLIDAGLGRKEDAIREGRRAMELLPVTRDPINGAHMIEFLAAIYAWSGEPDLACDQLGIATRIPGTLSYGQLRFYPFWDPLRGNPRFEKIVVSLAP
jgi:tetratricopeptide (TPR) repeat protein